MQFSVYECFSVGERISAELTSSEWIWLKVECSEGKENFGCVEVS